MAKQELILVADDDAVIREGLRRILSREGYQVETQPNGRLAMDRLQEAAFDLLITDLKMPGMDGLTLIREARRLSPTLPVVIITAYSTEASAIEAINLGVHGYLTKPFRITKILGTAAKALGE